MKSTIFSRSKSTVLKVLSCSALCMLLAGGCQRDAKETTPPAAKGNISDVLASQIKQQGHTISIPVNVSVPGVLTDAKGTEIRTNRFGRVLSTPDEICEDPSLAVVGPNTLTMLKHTIYDCENAKHSLTIEWKIRSSYDLAMVNPNNTAQFSKGRIRIKNGTAITYSDLTIPLATLNYIGDDPNEPDIKQYILTYTKADIPDKYLATGAFTDIEGSFAVYTDCPAPYGFVITTPYAFISAYGAVGLDPCQRIDNVYITPATPSTPPLSPSDCGVIAGSYVVGDAGACRNNTPNMASQVQVKKAGDPDASYMNIQSLVVGSSSPVTTDGLVYYWEIRRMKQLQFYLPGVTDASFPGDFTFRWRNVHGATNPCYGPWSVGVTYTIYDF
ncbi:hypothetical protein [Chitinophaga sp. CF418]|uniref:hypothetical protein n=1 Tax=Chitinophaga sp. CF418 TaxID=1855287 RepID=UPI0009154107|nr:hypothetical protein [Chitinophaga sp. CF418]SHN34350.1 hypothetical protein SAMN05216311_109278 [Chitinophaga sp. CF418]